MSNGQEVTHVCGARGFGLEPSDICPACEDARRIRLASSLPAVPANLKEAIEDFERTTKDKDSCQPWTKHCTHMAEYLAARSHLENLFLEQQREIERLRRSHRGTPGE